jgi:hypothetical protein
LARREKELERFVGFLAAASSGSGAVIVGFSAAGVSSGVMSMAFSVDDIASAVRAYISMSAAAARVSATQTSALRATAVAMSAALSVHRAQCKVRSAVCAFSVTRETQDSRNAQISNEERAGEAAAYSGT